MGAMRKSNKNRLFHREITIGSKPMYERFIVDKVPCETQDIIRAGIALGVGKIKLDHDRETLEELAGQTSDFFYKHLPFNLYSSAKEFYEHGEKQEAFDEAYFFDNKNAEPHLLSELIQDDLVNCIAQSVAIKEVLNDPKWDVFALYNRHSEGGHHIVATTIGPYCIRIDGSRGPQRKLKEKGNTEIYSFDKKIFYERYVECTHWSGTPAYK